MVSCLVGLLISSPENMSHLSAFAARCSGPELPASGNSTSILGLYPVCPEKTSTGPSRT